MSRSNLIYPGGRFFKRLAYLAIVYSIGANLFLNKLQDHLFLLGEEMIMEADTLSERAIYAADLIETYIVPGLDYVVSFVGNRIATHYRLDQGKETLEQNVEDVYQFQETLEVYAPTFSQVSTIIRWTSILFFIPILIAIIWLYYDLRWGRSRRFVSIALLLAVPWNWMLYDWLHGQFPFS